MDLLRHHAGDDADPLQIDQVRGDIALTPDGKYLVFGGPTTAAGSKYISLGDPTTGNVVATSGLDSIVLDTGYSNLEMPAFSPDGTKLALIESQWAGSINQRDNVLPSMPEAVVYLDFDETKPSFTPTLNKVVDSTSATLTATPGLAYPSFTPDSTAVAFHAGTSSTGCNSSGCDDNALDDGNLFISTLSGGTPIRMAKACDPIDPADKNSSVEPTFNPVIRGGYAWAVFTSMRKWGNQPWPANINKPTMLVNGRRRLWLAAVDPKIGTTDPSHPAIYLEGQDFTTPNMRAFYTVAKCIPSAGMVAPAGSPAVGTACTNGFECCSGFCQTQCASSPVSRLASASAERACRAGIAATPRPWSASTRRARCPSRTK